MRERLNQFKLVLILVDFFSILLIFELALFIRFDLMLGGVPPAPYNPQYYFLLSLVFAIGEVFIFMNQDHYSNLPVQEFTWVLRSTFLKVTFVVAGVLGFIFFFRGPSFSRLTVGYFWILNFSLTAFIHIFLGTLYKKFIFSKSGREGFVIVGNDKKAMNLVERLKKDPTQDLNFLGFFDDSKTENSLGKISDLRNFIRQNHTRIVFFSIPEKGDSEKFFKEINFCHSEGVKIQILPNFSEAINNSNIKIERVVDNFIVSVQPTPLARFRNRFFKRTFDIVFSIFVLLVFFPLFALIAFLIKITSKGKVFFKQERLGLDNKSFFIYKFRTMFEQSESDSNTKWTTANDKRVTKIGKILRKTSLDELPQFWNVLKGQMSVVGPRPERPHFAEKFREDFQNYMSRHQVKTGITGWAQVNGFRGDSSIQRRIESDTFYIENWSFRFDIKIILLTCVKVFFDESAY